MSDAKIFNSAPYYDDYSKERGFLKILFKPGYPVQNRELNQLQTIIQNQISTFGDHMFKEGAMILPGGVKVLNETFFKISKATRRETTSINSVATEISLNDYSIKKLVFSNDSGVTAQARMHHIDVRDDGTSVVLVAMKYVSAGTDGSSVFKQGDIVKYSYEEDGLTSSIELEISSDSNYVTNGMIAIGLKGVYYVRGYFVQTADEEIVVDPYKTSISRKIGYSITDKIVKSSDDVSLFDNASGFTNMGIEGADRYTIDLSLTSIEFSSYASSNESFIPMLTLEAGEILENVTRTNYNLIKDEIRKYHKDVYGDYIISPFLLSVNELSKLIDPENGSISVRSLGIDVTDYEYVSETYAKSTCREFATNTLDISSVEDSDLFFVCTVQQEQVYGSYGFKRGNYYPARDPKDLMDRMNSKIRVVLDGNGSVSLNGTVLKREFPTTLNISKPTEFESVQNQAVTKEFGSYIYVTECNKIPSIGETLYFTASNTAVDEYTSQVYKGHTFNHSRNTVGCYDVIGESVVLGVEYFSGNQGLGWLNTIPVSDPSVNGHFWHALAGADFRAANFNDVVVTGNQGIHNAVFNVASYLPDHQRGIYKVLISTPTMYTWEMVNQKTKEVISTASTAQAYIFDKSYNLEPTEAELASSLENFYTEGSKRFNYTVEDEVILDEQFIKTQKVPVEFIRGYRTAFQSSSASSNFEGSSGTVLVKYIIKNDTQPTINKLHKVMVPHDVSATSYLHGRIYHHEGNFILVKHTYDITTQSMWSDDSDGVVELKTGGDANIGGLRTNLALLMSWKNRLFAPNESFKILDVNGSPNGVYVADVDINSREIFSEASLGSRIIPTGRKFLKTLKPVLSINGADYVNMDTSYQVYRNFQGKVETLSTGEIGVIITLSDTTESIVPYNGNNWTCFLATSSSSTQVQGIPLEIDVSSIKYEDANRKMFFSFYSPQNGRLLPSKLLANTQTQVGYEVVVSLPIHKTAAERKKTYTRTGVLGESRQDNFGESLPVSTNIEEYIDQVSSVIYYSKIDLGVADALAVQNIYEIAPPTEAEMGELKDDAGNPTEDTKFQKIINGRNVDAEGNVSFTYVTINQATYSDVEFAYNEYKNQVRAAERGELVDNSGNPTVPTATKIELITSRFTLDNGQRKDIYDYASISLKPNAIKPLGRIYVDFSYYTHTDGDYFSIDSYSEGSYFIPKFNNESLADFIDFRPVKKRNTKSVIGTVSTILSGGTIMFDAQYYLGKMYKVIAFENNSGGLGIDIIEGKSHPNTPESPITPENSVWLYEIEMKPRIDSINDVKIRQNIERTKKPVDISNLEKRVSNLEYYITLSSKESETVNRKILDTDGNERFKTGIFVENFNDHTNADTENPDYMCSIDAKNGILRPAFFQESINLAVDRSNISSLLEFRDNLITLKYSDVILEQQTWATNTINANPFGTIGFDPVLKLIPSSDDWKDTATAPVRVVNQDATIPGLQQLAVQAGVNWGDWSSTWVGDTVNISESRTSTSAQSPNGWDGSGILETTNTEIVTTTTVTATIDQVRQGIALSASERTQTISLGTSVLNVTDIPFMRSRPIVTVLTGFKPNSFLYSYFDRYSVTGLVSPLSWLTIRMTQESFDTISVGKLYRVETAPNSGAFINFEIPHKRVMFYNDDGTFTVKLYVLQQAPSTQATQLPVGSRSNIIDVQTNSTIGTIDSFESNYVTYVNGVWVSSPDSNKRKNDINYGTARTDAVGDFVGVFHIPNSDAIRFRCGERYLEMYDDATISRSTVSASAKYVAYGSLVTSQETVLTTRSNVITSRPVTEERTITESQSSAVVRNEATIVEIKAPNPDNRQQILDAMAQQASLARSAQEAADRAAAQAEADRVAANQAQAAANAAAAAAASDRNNAAAAAAAANADRAAADAARSQAAADAQRAAANNAAAAAAANAANNLASQAAANNASAQAAAALAAQKAAEAACVPTCWTGCVNRPRVNCDPVAQTITILSPMSITGFDIFFASKPTSFNGTNQVTCELRPVENGYPSSEKVLGSKTLLPEEVKIDQFARVPTRFKFETPVLVTGGDYAIVVKAPFTTEYNIFISQVGEQLIGEYGIADKQPVLGSLFISQNQKTWTTEQLKDMKYRVYRAQYLKSPASFYIHDKLTDITGQRTDYSLLTENQFEIYMPESSTTHLLRVNHKNHNLFIGDKAMLFNLPKIRIAGNNGSYVDFSKVEDVFLDVVDVSPTSYSVRIPSNMIYGVPPKGVFSFDTPVKSYRNVNYNMVMLNSTYLEAPGSSVRIEMRNVTGRSYHGRMNSPYNVTSWKPTEVLKEEYFPTPMMIASEPNRLYRLTTNGASLDGWDAHSLQYKVTFESVDGLTTPVFDINRLSSIVVNNIVNSPDISAGKIGALDLGYIGDLENGYVENFISELQPKGGSVVNKYITKPILTMFPNIGLNLYSTYTQTEENQVRFFIRTSSSADKKTFDDSPWTEIVVNNQKIGTKTEVDMQYMAPAEFSAYQIKITMSARNSSSVPIVDDLRCIALGT